MSESIPERPASATVHRVREAVIRRWPFSEEHRAQEKAIRLEGWIGSGLNLLREQRFQEAVDYFENEEMAEKLDFGWEGIYTMPVKNPSEEAASFVGYAASKSYLGLSTDIESVYQARKKNKKPYSMQFGRIIASESDLNAGIPDSVFQEMALMHAEEWLHGLQYLRGRPLTRFFDDIPGWSVQSEVDVAVYLVDHGVKLAPQFLARYGRAEVLQKAGYKIS